VSYTRRNVKMKKGDKVIVKDIPKTLFKGDFYDRNYNKRILTVKKAMGKFVQIEELEEENYWNGWLLKNRLEVVK
jgi:hypothetical protein